MYETVKEVEEETIIEENIMSLTRDNTTSLQDDNVDYIGEINNLLMIKEGVTKQLDNWKMICVYIEWCERYFQDKLPEIVIYNDSVLMKTLRKLCRWLLNYCKKTK